MAKPTRFNDQLTVGPQPTADQIDALPNDGFKSIVNFRTSGEDEQPMSPEEEATRAKSAGLEYLHVPVSMDAMDMGKVDGFRRKFDSLPKPVFAHCKSGKRAGAMMMMHNAVEEGWSGDEALEKARQMGFECDQPELEQFVKNYVDSRVAAKTS